MTVYFYPRPPGGGRHFRSCPMCQNSKFLSTPSGWRATIPPLEWTAEDTFLSTPSGWRATLTTTNHAHIYSYFYPRPPGGGRPKRDRLWCCFSYFYPRPPGGGRHVAQWYVKHFFYFYPRPPGGGRPTWRNGMSSIFFISIHALRVEGDR